MSKPKISIVTIVLNKAEHLEQCMKSVLDQAYDQLEYIVIDGGSTDGSVEIIQKFQDKLAYWVSEPDEGISHAFNKGIQKATGELVGMVNADDWLEQNCLNTLAGCLNGSDIYYGDLKQWFGSSFYIASARHDLLPFRMSLNHPATFARRTLYNETGLYDESFRIAMDYEWLLRNYLAGKRFFRIPQALCNMRMDGASRQLWLKGLREVRNAKCKHLRQPIRANISYTIQVLKTAGSLWLMKSSLSSLFNIYRSRFAAVRKEKMFQEKVS